MTKINTHQALAKGRGKRGKGRGRKKDRLKDVLNLEVVVVVIPGRERASEVEDWTFKNGSLNWEESFTGRGTSTWGWGN